MTRVDSISIRLKDPIRRPDLDPPEDPVEGLSTLESGLLRFCFDHNRQVSITIGDEELDVWLYPDMYSLIPDLTTMRSHLVLAKDVELGFPERAVNLDLVPLGDRVSCAVRHFGQAISEKEFVLDTARLIEAVEDFLIKIIGLAVEARYISPELGHAVIASCRES